jgi:hypothetical protein
MDKKIQEGNRNYENQPSGTVNPNKSNKTHRG